MAEGFPTTINWCSEQELRDIIRSIILELAPDPRDNVDGNMRLVDDLGYHSLAMMELAFTLEDEFDLPTIDEETARTIQRVIEVEDHVVQCLRERGDLAG